MHGLTEGAVVKPRAPLSIPALAVAASLLAACSRGEATPTSDASPLGVGGAPLRSHPHTPRLPRRPSWPSTRPTRRPHPHEPARPGPAAASSAAVHLAHPPARDAGHGPAHVGVDRGGAHSKQPEIQLPPVHIVLAIDPLDTSPPGSLLRLARHVHCGESQYGGASTLTDGMRLESPPSNTSRGRPRSRRAGSPRASRSIRSSGTRSTRGRGARPARRTSTRAAPVRQA